MSITEAIKTCFRKYVDFSGRARRSEYWYWVLFTMVVNMVVAALERSDSYTLSYLISAALFLPGLGVAVRLATPVVLQLAAAPFLAELLLTLTHERVVVEIPLTGTASAYHIGGVH